MMHACRPRQRARRVQCTTSGWCFVEESISTVIKELLEDKSSEVSNGESVLATVIDDQEKERTCPPRPRMET